MIDEKQIPTAIAPTTTAEENKKTAGQRRVNIIWETTQATIALAVTFATLLVCLGKGVSDV